MIRLLAGIARSLLPDDLDPLIDVAEDLADDWAEVAKAYRDGAQPANDAAIARAVAATLDQAPRPAGYAPGDSAAIGAAAAVVVRWIATAAPRRKARRLRHVGS